MKQKNLSSFITSLHLLTMGSETVVGLEVFVTLKGSLSSLLHRCIVHCSVCTGPCKTTFLELQQLSDEVTGLQFSARPNGLRKVSTVWIR